MDANITAKISTEKIRTYFRNLSVNKLRIMTKKKSGLNLQFKAPNISAIFAALTYLDPLPSEKAQA